LLLISDKTPPPILAGAFLLKSLPVLHDIYPAMVSAITSALYRQLGLPTGGTTIPAEYNEFTRQADGNTDANRDGKIDAGDKNGTIETAEVWQGVIAYPKYKPVIEALFQEGFEDPFEDRSEILAHVDALFNKYAPQNELEKALLLFTSIIPSYKDFVFEGKKYSGLMDDEGGLGIPADQRDNSYLREKFGDLLPRELLAAHPALRGAYCLEYSHLMVAALRYAGIKAAVKYERGNFFARSHAYVVAELNGEKYKLDLLTREFARTDETPNLDREAVGLHYLNEGAVFHSQQKTAAAIDRFNLALEIDPSLAGAWFSLGLISRSRADLPAALNYFERALAAYPNFVEAQRYKCLILQAQNRTDTGKQCSDDLYRILEQNARQFNGEP